MSIAFTDEWEILADFRWVIAEGGSACSSPMLAAGGGACFRLAGD
jgi:hypothetical protein